MLVLPSDLLISRGAQEVLRRVPKGPLKWPVWPSGGSQEGCGLAQGKTLRVGSPRARARVSMFLNQTIRRRRSSGGLPPPEGTPEGDLPGQGTPAGRVLHLPTSTYPISYYLLILYPYPVLVAEPSSGERDHLLSPS